MRRGCRLPAAAGVCTTYNFSNKKHSNGKGAKKPKYGKEKQVCATLSFLERQSVASPVINAAR